MWVIDFFFFFLHFNCTQKRAQIKSLHVEFRRIGKCIECKTLRIDLTVSRLIAFWLEFVLPHERKPYIEFERPTWSLFVTRTFGRTKFWLSRINYIVVIVVIVCYTRELWTRGVRGGVTRSLKSLPARLIVVSTRRR